MFNSLKSTIIIIAFFLNLYLGISQSINSDTSIQKTSLSLEIDPLVPLVIKGVGAHFFIQTKYSKHVLYGLGFIYKGTIPDAMINFDKYNKDKGWSYKVNFGLALEGEYYYGKSHKKWFSGFQVFYQKMRLKNIMVSENLENKFNTGMIVLNTGYKWFPFKKTDLYIKPWAGISYTGIIGSKTTKIGSQTYHIQALMPFATIHIGYKF